jgi:Tol biopolymer transport system component
MTTRPFFLTLRIALFAFLTALLFNPAPTPAAPAATPGASVLAVARELSALGPTDGRVKALITVGEQAFAIAAYDEENRFEIYRIPLAGGLSQRLSAGLPMGEAEQLEPAGDYVVFSYRFHATGQRALYTVPVAGGEPLRLTPEYASTNLGNGLFGFLVAGDRAVYAVDQEQDNVPLLYSVSVAGGPAVKLSPDLPDFFGSKWRVRGVQSSDDNSTIAYSMTLSGGDSARIYVTPAATPASNLVSGVAAPVSGNIADFALAPDGSRVVYRATGNGSTRIVSVTNTGADVQELSAAFATFKITPDSARVVLVSTAPGDASPSLSSLPIGGGSATPLAAAVGSSSLTLSPDGTDVYFTPTAGGLQRVPVAGGAASEVLAGLSVDHASLQFAGDRLFFQAGPYGSTGLYVSHAGGAATRIDDENLTGGRLFAHSPAPDGSVVYYTAQAATDPRILLYRVSGAGGGSIKLNPEGPAAQLTLIQDVDSSGAVLFTQGTPLGQGLEPSGGTIYRAESDASAPTALFSSRAIVGDVIDFDVSASDGLAVYRADQDTDDVQELYSVPVAGGTPTQLNSEGQHVHKFAISPVGGVVVYQSNNQLYSVPIGGGTVTQIGEAAPSGQGVASYSFTHNGAQVFYIVQPFGSPPQPGGLYRAPATGGAAQLVAPNAVGYWIDPTGARALFATEGFPDQLYSVPTSGGDATFLGPIEESPSLLFSPDGSRVLYQKAGTIWSVLVSQPVAGGDAIWLADVFSKKQISADGAYVLSAGLLDGTRALQIRRTPIDGGETTILLERRFPLETDYSQISFEFQQAPGGGPVVFAIANDLPAPGSVEHELGSVPIDGGDPVALFGPAPLPNVNLPFALSDDGGTLLFKTIGDLYRVPSAGNASPIEVSGEKYVGEFAFGSDGAALFFGGGELYRAAPGEPATRVDGLPEGFPADLPLQLNSTIVFLGTHRTITTPYPSGMTKLYAVDLESPDPRPFKSNLPLLQR